MRFRIVPHPNRQSSTTDPTVGLGLVVGAGVLRGVYGGGGASFDQLGQSRLMSSPIISRSLEAARLRFVGRSGSHLQDA